MAGYLNQQSCFRHPFRAGTPPQGDAIQAIETFTEQLKDPQSSLEQKQLALRFIIHLIGDLHQPLHTGNGTDRGGNQTEVIYFWEKSNLHRVWDSQMIDGEKLSYSEMGEWIGNKITADQVSNWNNIDPRTWTKESATIRDTVYPDDPNINYSYKYENMPIVKNRLSMAGVRIAAYLNEVFKSEG